MRVRLRGGRYPLETNRDGLPVLPTELTARLGSQSSSSVDLAGKAGQDLGSTPPLDA